MMGIEMWFMGFCSEIVHDRREGGEYMDERGECRGRVSDILITILAMSLIE